MSFTTNSLVSELAEAGRKLPHPWLLDSDGNPTDDPAPFAVDAVVVFLPLLFGAWRSSVRRCSREAADAL